ncbi:MAG: pyridoxal phosphate-dependent decarboxylase family protein [Dermatophilaceae bacterium]
MGESSQEWVLGAATADAMLAAATRVVQMGMKFKRRSPLELGDPMERTMVEKVSTIGADGVSLDELLEWLDVTVFPGSLNLGSPTFLAHPDSGASTAGVLGEIANAFLNQNLSSIDYSPVATQLEQHLLRQLRGVVGYPETGDLAPAASGGGIVFGGSQANYSGLLAAREHLRHTLATQQRRYDPRRARVLANRPYTHFSLRRSLHLLGLGNSDLNDRQLAEDGLERESLREVAADGLRTDPADLERQILAVRERGEDVMAIFAVAGDSRFMTFDDLEAICDVAERYDIWVHVDACEGGQVLFSPHTRHRMSGVQRAHSIALDPHKVLLVPYNISVFFLRDPAWMGYFATNPTTLINQDDTSLGATAPGINSKAFISLKLIMMLRHWGWRRIAREIERRHELALFAARLIQEHPRLRLLNPQVEHNAVGFAYLPAGDPDLAAVNTLNRAIHERLHRETPYFIHAFPSRDGLGVISPGFGSVYALRMMFGNPLSGPDEVTGALAGIVALGDELARCEGVS